MKIFADGADLKAISALAEKPYIEGFTTNPTLMSKAGVKDYTQFAHQALDLIGRRPISFEVVSDDADEMFRQARIIASWGDNVYVKIPITNSIGESSMPLLRRLVEAGIKTNVTAIMTLDQVREAASVLAAGPSAYVSVFAGRIADTGRDPMPIMSEAVTLLRPHPQLELIWASPRELLNIVHASEIGCHVITVTNDILAKLPMLGKDLDEYSLETVQMFFRDATQSGLDL
ncbi:MAG TPA: transaldolase [Caulobacteraceae bacterium]|nr:transaldolase [Caulobacteraceae bacterium]